MVYFSLAKESKALCDKFRDDPNFKDQEFRCCGAIIKPNNSKKLRYFQNQSFFFINIDDGEKGSNFLREYARTTVFWISIPIKGTQREDFKGGIFCDTIEEIPATLRNLIDDPKLQLQLRMEAFHEEGNKVLRTDSFEKAKKNKIIIV